MNKKVIIVGIIIVIVMVMVIFFITGKKKYNTGEQFQELVENHFNQSQVENVNLDLDIEDPFNNEVVYMEPMKDELEEWTIIEDERD